MGIERVVEVRRADGKPLIIKRYRPERAGKFARARVRFGRLLWCMRAPLVLRDRDRR